MLADMSSNDARIKIVTTARRVTNDDTNGFAVVNSCVVASAPFRRVSQITRLR